MTSINGRLAVLEEMFLESVAFADDQKLLNIAKLVLEEGTTKGASYYDKRGTAAAKLIALLPKPSESGHCHVLVWEFLINDMFAGWRNGIIPSAEEELRTAILNLPAPNKVLEKIFETVIRENFAKCENPDLLHRLLANVDQKSNLIVVRKAAQTAVIRMPPEAIAFTFACWNPLPLFARKSSGERNEMLSMIRGLTVECIGRISNTVAAARDLLDHLPPMFGSEGGTTIEFANEGKKVKFHWRTGHRTQNSTDCEEGYIKDSALVKAADHVKNWRDMNRSAPKFQVEIWVHLMPSSWIPGENATAERTLSLVCD